MNDLGVEEPCPTRSGIFTSSLRTARTRHGMCLSGTILLGFGLVLTGTIIMALSSNHHKKSMLQSIKDKDDVDPVSFAGPAVLVGGALVMVFGFITCVCITRKRRNSDEKPILEDANCPDISVPPQEYSSTVQPSTTPSNYGSMHGQADIHTSSIGPIDESTVTPSEGNIIKSPQEIPKLPPPVPKKSRAAPKSSNSLNQPRKDVETFAKVIEEEPESNAANHLESSLLDMPITNSQIPNTDLVTGITPESKGKQTSANLIQNAPAPNVDSPSSNIPPVEKLIERFENKTTKMPQGSNSEVDGPMDKIEEPPQSLDRTAKASEECINKGQNEVATQSQEGSLCLSEASKFQTVETNNEKCQLQTVSELAHTKDDSRIPDINVTMASEEQNEGSKKNTGELHDNSTTGNVKEARSTSDASSELSISSDCETLKSSEENIPTTEVSSALKNPLVSEKIEQFLSSNDASEGFVTAEEEMKSETSS